MSTVIPQYPFDPTGLAQSNQVVETQAIKSRGTFDYYYVVPRVSPFYAEGAELRLYPVGTSTANPLGGQLLEEGVHYSFGYHFAQASHTIGKPVYGAITFFDRTMEGQLRMVLQTVGGDWVLDDQAMNELLLNTAYNPRIATWEQLVELPHQFPVVNHDFSVDDFVGMSEVVDELGDIERAILQSNEGGLQQHIEDQANPHQVTKIQVGLGLVDNYPTATIAEATGGTANNRFMTPLRTKQLIDTVATAALVSHQGDYTNPHQVTKTQVGLGNVQNLALATQAEAEAGASHARYMTALRTREAIIAIVGNRLDGHIGDYANPHQVTKAQVGLGNVQNIGIATDVDALSGLGDSGVITPRLLSLVLSETVGEGVTDHIQDSANPHGVTKAQVGLGSVENFGIATEVEAQEATAANKYMTPLAVRQAINALVGDSSNAHVTDFDNPHAVTAAQVGTYDRDQINLLLNDKLDLNDTAGDSARLFGLNQEGLAAWIGSITSGNALKFDGKTYNEVKLDILAGKAADSAKLDGKSYADIKAEISAVSNASSFQYPIGGVPAVANSSGIIDSAPLNWLKIGTMLQPLNYTYADMTLLITGGRDEDLETGRHQTVLFEIATTNDYPDPNPAITQMPLLVREAVCKHLTPATWPIVIGYVVNQSPTRPSIDFYIKSTGMMTPWTVTELSDKLFTPFDNGLIDEVSDLITVEPQGIAYATVLLEGSAEIEALQQFTQRRDNPHVVTKAQVGLGSVDNYPTATQVEAEAGTATNRFMTPLRTKQLIDKTATAALNTHIADKTNPHAVTKAQVGLGNVDNYGTASTAMAITGTATDKFMTPASTTAKVDDSIGILCDELILVMDDAMVNLFP